MEFYFLDKDDVINKLSVNPKKGLDNEEVKKRSETYGLNILKEKKKKSTARRFFEQFKDVMIIILIVAAIVSFLLALIEKNYKEFFEPLLILLIVILNATMGVLQESKAEKALESLKNISAPHARVVRGGEENIIDASYLVPGDIIKLEAGDFVPADARLLESSSLKSEESALTGESVPSEKDAKAEVTEKSPLADRNNMVFSGCSITYGTATAVVTAIGMETQIGRIANLLDNEQKAETPLQKKLAELGKYLGIVAILACGIIFFIGLNSGIKIREIFMTSISLAVSAIPEGLPAIVTIVLSIGVQRMVKRNALIRRLPAVETLGCASVICSDKTGTLTQNRMTLKEAYCDGGSIEKISDENSENIRQLLMFSTLCCDGNVVFNGDDEKLIGDPTETAIILAAHKKGIVKDELIKKYPRLLEIPFDSDRKLMTTINSIDGKNIVIVKGAFDVLSNKCISGDIKKAKVITEEMSKRALRVIAVAYKEIGNIPVTASPDDIEKDLTFMGIVGMIDPPREEAKEAVRICINAGIKPVMITGDHVITASAIAKELGILSKNDRAITGIELDKMNDSELEANVENISVYARVSPENKIRIVKAWQKNGKVVSMTGDGVNDAPALKAADIGCAMGITGTDVAKGAADMTLTDDNFATIVEAVREGRGIYANIRKVVGFLLGTNIGEVIAVFLAMLLWHKTPLLSMQLLWINLVTDSLPAIALGMEAVDTDIMNKAPRSKTEGIFAHGLGIRIILQGIMFACLTLIGFRYGENVTGTLAGGQTTAFMVLALSQVMQSLNMRSERSLFKIGMFTNKNLNLAVMASIVLVALVLFTPLRIAFGLVILPLKAYFVAFVLIFVPTVLMELAKMFKLIRN